MSRTATGTRKSRGAKHSIRVIVLAALALIVIAGCSGSSGYSDEVRTNFVKACLDAGGTMGSCECSLEYIEGQKTEAEFVRIDAELEYEGIVDDVIYEALAKCDPTSLAFATTIPATMPQIRDALSDYFESTGISDTPEERADAKSLGEYMEYVLAETPEGKSLMANCEPEPGLAWTPDSFIDAMFETGFFAPLTRSEFRRYAYAAAEVYASTKWGMFVVACG